MKTDHRSTRAFEDRPGYLRKRAGSEGGDHLGDARPMRAVETIPSPFAYEKSGRHENETFVGPAQWETNQAILP
ncbi:MAG: hypothetical protein CV090_08780 [Nitrospira sp. WS238]|nr:hypothetical protein [Nitrospira sp. WS238]